MRVPLIAELRHELDATLLTIWRNGKQFTITPPIKPFLYSKEDLGEIRGVTRFEEEKRLLSSLVKTKLWKYETSKTSTIFQIKDEFNSFVSDTNFCDARLPLVHSILIQRPEFFKQFPNDEPLKVAFIDIEQYNDGYFPTTKDPILCIGVGFSDHDTQILLAKNIDDEKRILVELNNLLTSYQPDLIVGYNHIKYDIPMLVARMNHFGINYLSAFSKTSEFKINEDNNTIDAGGVIYYDLYHSVSKDQTLHGIKNRKMKTVAKRFGLEGVIEIDYSEIKNLIGTNTLKEYNLSDIVISKELFNIYFPKIEGMAEYLGSPLSELIPFADSFPGTILQGRILFTKGIVSDGTNSQMFPKCFPKGVDGKTKSFEGANVDIFKRGKFKPIYKYDFASLYPHIFWSMGIGPDNTTLVDVLPLSHFSCIKKDDTKIYSIPDKKLNCNFVIKVKGDSDVAKFIKEMLHTRLELKEESKLLKRLGSVKDFEALESYQYALKVVLNSVYGVNGAEHLSYGSAPVAIMIVGVARELIIHLKNLSGSSAVEMDTDGLYTDSRLELEWINVKINHFTKSSLLGEPVFKIDEDEYPAGWFHEQKSYLLLEESDDGFELIKHGVAFKGSHLPEIFDKTIDSVAMTLLTKGELDAKVVALKCLDLSQYDPSDFVQQIKLNKNQDEYANENALALQVAKDCRKKTGFPLTVGNTYKYLKTKKGYEFFVPEAFGRIDVAYYRDIIHSALGRLGFENVQQRRLIEFGSG